MKNWTRRLCQSLLMLLSVAAVIPASASAAALPDLKVSSMKAAPAADAGTVVNVVTTVANRGTADAGVSFLKLYLSTDTVLNATDIEIGGRSVPALPVGALNTGTTAVTIPLATPMGDHYILAQADADDAVAESGEKNNVKAVPIGIGPGPDLASWTFVPATGCAGAEITVTDKTKNLGNLSADPSTTYFYLSTDRTFDPGDLLLGGRPVPSLLPGQFNMGSIVVTLPATLEWKPYFIFAIADGAHVVAEISETYAEFAKITINCGPEICGDGIDNDGDGLIDENCVEICGDGIDNDGDGLIDEDCVEICGDGTDNDGDGLIDEDCVEICGDGVDNDGDGLIDENCVEICGDGVDNDGDGLIDENCVEICGDGVDNDGDGLIDEDCAPSNPGTGTPGYWMNHPGAWPVALITIGGIDYPKADAIALMRLPVSGDKTLTMFPHLLSAKLNLLIGNDGSCIAATIADADAWMAVHPVGSGVSASSAAWTVGGPLATRLDSYNNGLLCAPHRK